MSAFPGYVAAQVTRCDCFPATYTFYCIFIVKYAIICRLLSRVMASRRNEASQWKVSAIFSVIFFLSATVKHLSKICCTLFAIMPTVSFSAAVSCLTCLLDPSSMRFSSTATGSGHYVPATVLTPSWVLQPVIVANSGSTSTALVSQVTKRGAKRCINNIIAACLSWDSSLICFVRRTAVQLLWGGLAWAEQRLAADIITVPWQIGAGPLKNAGWISAFRFRVVSVFIVALCWRE